MLTDVGPLVFKDLSEEFLPLNSEDPPCLKDLINKDIEILVGLKETCGTSKISESSWLFMSKALQWTVIKYSVDDQWTLNDKNSFTFDPSVLDPERAGHVTLQAKTAFDKTLQIPKNSFKTMLKKSPEVYTAFHTTSTKVRWVRCSQEFFFNLILYLFCQSFHSGFWTIRERQHRYRHGWSQHSTWRVLWEP